MASQRTVRWPRRGRAAVDGLQNRPYRPEGRQCYCRPPAFMANGGGLGAGPPAMGCRGPWPLPGVEQGAEPLRLYPDASIQRMEAETGR